MRKNYISWNEYFMKISYLSAQRSKDPITQVGACIVDSDNKIIGIGYNGLPYGFKDKKFNWKLNDLKQESKYHYVIHAELNAIINCHTNNLKKCSLYVTLFPCNECAKVIIQTGIKFIYYSDDKYKNQLSNIIAKKMFKVVGIKTLLLRLSN